MRRAVVTFARGLGMLDCKCQACSNCCVELRCHKEVSLRLGEALTENGLRQEALSDGEEPREEWTSEVRNVGPGVPPSASTYCQSKEDGIMSN